MYKCFNILQTIVSMSHFTFKFSRKLGTSCHSIAMSCMVQLCWSMKEEELLKNTFQVCVISCQCLVATKAKCPKTESDETKTKPFLSFSLEGTLYNVFPDPLELRWSGLIGAMLTILWALSFFTIKHAGYMGYGIR